MFLTQPREVNIFFFGLLNKHESMGEDILYFWLQFSTSLSNIHLFLKMVFDSFKFNLLE
jgi:hypothetical protein